MGTGREHRTEGDQAEGGEEVEAMGSSLDSLPEGCWEFVLAHCTGREVGGLPVKAETLRMLSLVNKHFLHIARKFGADELCLQPGLSQLPQNELLRVLQRCRDVKSVRVPFRNWLNLLTPSLFCWGTLGAHLLLVTSFDGSGLNVLDASELRKVVSAFPKLQDLRFRSEIEPPQADLLSVVAEHCSSLEHLVVVCKPSMNEIDADIEDAYISLAENCPRLKTLAPFPIQPGSQHVHGTLSRLTALEKVKIYLRAIPMFQQDADWQQEFQDLAAYGGQFTTVEITTSAFETPLAGNSQAFSAFGTLLFGTRGPAVGPHLFQLVKSFVNVKELGLTCHRLPAALLDSLCLALPHLRSLWVQCVEVPHDNPRIVPLPFSRVEEFGTVLVDARPWSVDEEEGSDGEDQVEDDDASASWNTYRPTLELFRSVFPSLKRLSIYAGLSSLSWSEELEELSVTELGAVCSEPLRRESSRLRKLSIEGCEHIYDMDIVLQLLHQPGLETLRLDYPRWSVGSALKDAPTIVQLLSMKEVFCGDAYVYKRFRGQSGLFSCYPNLQSLEIGAVDEAATLEALANLKSLRRLKLCFLDKQLKDEADEDFVRALRKVVELALNGSLSSLYVDVRHGGNPELTKTAVLELLGDVPPRLQVRMSVL
ncbi:hypothetical protein KFL_005140080 [Klebsormidium nitens]|uniref:Uncharacterized protein n=1 Tax=Klebsormidium nitens TaxID=105231 RepID=A0A1Y1IEJ0_KLENI|nr:hypothetical protein KFL_005140080 [Klebsormidium nitens]|eukprot:GAQ89364.1 hypothetical protein KFL_005140080 [Klebsormidium nitens]